MDLIFICASFLNSGFWLWASNTLVETVNSYHRPGWILNSCLPCPIIKTLKKQLIMLCILQWHFLKSNKIWKTALYCKQKKTQNKQANTHTHVHAVVSVPQMQKILAIIHSGSSIIATDMNTSHQLWAFFKSFFSYGLLLVCQTRRTNFSSEFTSYEASH